MDWDWEESGIPVPHEALLNEEGHRIVGIATVRPICGLRCLEASSEGEAKCDEGD
jgi:hypothetical protein